MLNVLSTPSEDKSKKKKEKEASRKVPNPQTGNSLLHIFFYHHAKQADIEHNHIFDPWNFKIINFDHYFIFLMFKLRFCQMSDVVSNLCVA